MKIIRNNIIPFKGFTSMNLFGFIFVRKDVKLSEEIINHEAIHSELYKELGYIFFIFIYLLEWLYRILFTNDCFSKKAYEHISFEKEAYSNMKNLKYLDERKIFAMWRK